MKHRQKPPPQELPGDRYGRTVEADFVRELADCRTRLEYRGGIFRPALECLDAPDFLPGGSIFQFFDGLFRARPRYVAR